MNVREYKFKFRNIIEEYVKKDLIEKYKLQPNFDIIKFLNEYKIQTVGVEDIENYGLSFEDNNCKIYYQTDLRLMNANEKILTVEQQKRKEYIKRDIRFVLAMALGDILILSNYGKGELHLIPYNNQQLYIGLCDSFDRDWIVSEFAGELLMPRRDFEAEIEFMTECNRRKKADPIEELSDKFGVNYQASYCRCKQLGYTTVKKNK